MESERATMSVRTHNTIRSTLALLAALIALLALPGCMKSGNDFDAFIKEPRPLVTSTEYLMAPPDAIMIVSKRVREINNHIEQIRPDGRITLPLVGSVFVAGKTCDQVSAELSELASEFYEDAEVTVWVTAFRSQKVFVFGEVELPGPYPYTGTNTVLKMLAMAQPTRLSNPDKIHVLRPNEDGELAKHMTVSLDDMVKHGDTSLDAVLEEGDVIFVPANGLAAVGLALQQFLLPLQPAAATVRAPADIYDYSGSPVYGGDRDIQ